MAHRYCRGNWPKEDYVHFWFTNNLTGRTTQFTVDDSLIQKAITNSDNFCDVLELIIKRLEEEKYYEHS